MKRLFIATLGTIAAVITLQAKTSDALCTDTCTECTLTTTDALAVLNTAVGLNPVNCSTTTTSTTSTTIPLDTDCGTGTPQPCSVTVDSPAGMYTDLQTAINAANDGATLMIEGDCTGSVSVVERNGLIFEGVAPTPDGCPDSGLVAGSLPSTVHAVGEDPGILLDDSANILVRYLNIVDSDGEGVKLRGTTGSVVSCSCAARNGQAGISIDGGERNTLKDNLVVLNTEEGIRIDESNYNRTLGNRAVGNTKDGFNMSSSEANTITLNSMTDNGDDGIGLAESDDNVILLNQVLRNVDAGISLSDSNDNRVSANEIRTNGDGEIGLATCSNNSEDNFGSNIPSDCD